MKNMKKRRILGPFIFLAVFAAGAAVVMLLWNWLVPSIIGWSVVRFWQAAGLLLLCKILFGSFRKGGGMPFHRPDSRMRKFMHDRHEEIHDKVKNMSKDERREYIRNYMFGGRPTDCHNDDK